jgi:murein L,D-transpeptidase YafK
MRMRSVLCSLAAPTAAPMLMLVAPVADPAATLLAADTVVVHKTSRRMELLRDGNVIASYRIALGLDPSGPKQREGDFRTPEGRYALVRRNPNSDFFLSIQISYPNPNDVREARRRGWEPGGSIMIHGLPNKPRHPPDYYATRDWTDGCIAVTNSEMVEIWLMTRRDTPIEIRP